MDSQLVYIIHIHFDFEDTEMFLFCRSQLNIQISDVVFEVITVICHN